MRLCRATIVFTLLLVSAGVAVGQTTESLFGIKLVPVPGGLKITGVETPSSAATNQLQVNDLIIGLDGASPGDAIPLTAANTLLEFSDSFLLDDSKGAIKLWIQRGAMTFSVTLSRATSSVGSPVKATPIPGGMKVDTYTASDGVLLPGDIITKVIGSNVPLTSQAIFEAEALAHKDGNNEVHLFVKRPPANFAVLKTIKFLPAQESVSNLPLTATAIPGGMRVDTYTASDGVLLPGDIITQVIGSMVALTSQAVLDAEVAKHTNPNNEVYVFVKRPPSNIASPKTIKLLAPLPPGTVRLANPGLTYSSTPNGLTISDVLPNSRATKGAPFALMSGWLIVKLNGATVIGLTEPQINALLAAPNVRVTVKVTIEYTTVLP